MRKPLKSKLTAIVLFVNHFVPKISFSFIANRSFTVRNYAQLLPTISMQMNPIYLKKWNLIIDLRQSLLKLPEYQCCMPFTFERAMQVRNEFYLCRYSQNKMYLAQNDVPRSKKFLILNQLEVKFCESETEKKMNSIRSEEHNFETSTESWKFNFSLCKIFFLYGT